MDRQFDTVEQAYNAFIDEVCQKKMVWGVFNESSQGWAVCPSESFEDTDVLPFWSSKEAAQAVCNGEWSDYVPKTLSLEEFQLDWLPGMHEDDALVGPNWDQELNGLELEPADVAKELELALQETEGD